MGFLPHACERPQFTPRTVARHGAGAMVHGCFFFKVYGVGRGSPTPSLRHILTFDLENAVCGGKYAFRKGIVFLGFGEDLAAQGQPKVL